MMKASHLRQKLSISQNCSIFCLRIYLFYDKLTILLPYLDASSNTRARGIIKMISVVLEFNRAKTKTKTKKKNKKKVKKLNGLK